MRPDQTQQQENGNSQRFHPKVHNLASIQFTENETQLSNKALKYNLHFIPKNCSRTLVLEAETAISYANESEQNYLRQAVSKTVRNLINQSIQNNITAKQEWATMKDINKRITEHTLIIAQGDKGKAIVIIQEQEHNKIANDFMCKNQFTRITHEPIKQRQTIIKQYLEHIPKQLVWKYNNINTQTPSLRASMKLRKTPISIRPIINWCKSPASDTKSIEVPSPYNITNTLHLTTGLRRSNIIEDTRICSLDISNMYTNILWRICSEHAKQRLRKQISTERLFSIRSASRTLLRNAEVN
jgi:hypothetical protein